MSVTAARVGHCQSELPTGSLILSVYGAFWEDELVRAEKKRRGYEAEKERFIVLLVENNLQISLTAEAYHY